MYVSWCESHVVENVIINLKQFFYIIEMDNSSTTCPFDTQVTYFDFLISYPDMMLFLLILF